MPWYLDTLQNISLKNITKNSNLNYHLILKNGMKIPTAIGNIIYDYFIMNIPMDCKNLNLKLFHKNIVSLSKFKFDSYTTTNLDDILMIDLLSLREIQFSRLAFFNEINFHKLKDFFKRMKNIENINLSLSNKNIELFSFVNFSKTLKYAKLLYFDTNLPFNLNDLFENCLLLEELSITNEYNNNNNNYFNMRNIFKLKNLQSLSFYSFPITFKSRDNPGETINENLTLKSLKYIKIHNCQMKISDWKIFGKMFGNCSNIEYAYFNTTRGVKFLCEGLKNSKKRIKSITFKDCCLHEENGKALREFLLNCHQLKKIDFSSNNLEVKVLKNILNGLISSCHSLKDISFENCSLDTKCCKVLREFLLLCKHLENLNFSRNQLIRDGIKDIWNGLKLSSGSLQSLNFLESVNYPQHLKYMREKQNENKEIEIQYFTYNSNNHYGESVYSIYNDLPNVPQQLQPRSLLYENHTTFSSNELYKMQNDQVENLEKDNENPDEFDNYIERVIDNSKIDFSSGYLCKFLQMFGIKTFLNLFKFH